MAKFFGVIGYAADSKEGAGENEGVVIEHPIIERSYYGDEIKSGRKWENGENINDNLVIDTRLSIVADAYAYEHLSAMKYVSWLGALWKITHVDIQRPRLILTIGGVYNGQTSGSTP